MYFCYLSDPQICSLFACIEGRGNKTKQKLRVRYLPMYLAASSVIVVIAAAAITGPTDCDTLTPSPSSTTGLKLELSVPELVGASRNASTHYWFPTNCAFSFNESHLLLDVRLADDCSDYYCNKTHTHKPSDPSHQILQSLDGGATFAPLYTVHGHSPWDSQTALKPFLGPCTIDVNATSRMVLYQGQIRAPWQVRGA